VRARLLTLVQAAVTSAGVVLAGCTALLPGNEPIQEIEAGSDGGVVGDDAGVGDAGAHHDAGDDAGALPNPDAGDVSDAGGEACPAMSERSLVVMKNELSSDTHWTCDTTYEIQGTLVMSAGTLTIDPGVRVLGRERAALLIGKGARIVAEGTAEQPIVFTAKTRPAEPATWRGLFMLGSAPAAYPNNSALGLSVTDPRGFFGGTDDSHDCGTLKYVRIEFAGGQPNDYDFPAAALTLAGCGSDTEVDHVQVHAGSDGIGLVGGRAPLKRVLVTAPTDDGIEWAVGYQGLIQFAVVQTFYGIGAALKGSRSEIDETSPPPSFPFIFNATLIGASAQGLPRGRNNPAFETALQLQAGTRAVIRNSLVHGFHGTWIDVIGASTAALVGGDTQISNTIFAGPEPRPNPGFPDETKSGQDDDASFSEDTTFRTSALQNRFPGASFSLRSPFNAPPGRPDFSAEAFVDSSSLSNQVPPDWSGVLEPAAYAGALPRIRFTAERAQDWTASTLAEGEGWTSFPQE
jgi:hypothetical protein